MHGWKGNPWCEWQIMGVAHLGTRELSLVRNFWEWAHLEEMNPIVSLPIGNHLSKVVQWWWEAANREMKSVQLES